MSNKRGRVKSLPIICNTGTKLSCDISLTKFLAESEAICTRQLISYFLTRLVQSVITAIWTHQSIAGWAPEASLISGA